MQSQVQATAANTVTVTLKGKRSDLEMALVCACLYYSDYTISEDSATLTYYTEQTNKEDSIAEVQEYVNLYQLDLWRVELVGIN